MCRWGRRREARPIQRFEGSRPWGGDYAYSIALGLGEKLGEQVLEPARARRGWLGESLRVVVTCLLCLRECIFKSLRKSLYGSFLAKLFYFFIFRDVLKSHLLTNRLDHLQEFRDLFFSYQIDL